MVFPPETDGPQEAPCGRGSDYCTSWTSWSMGLPGDGGRDLNGAGVAVPAHTARETVSPSPFRVTELPPTDAVSWWG